MGDPLLSISWINAAGSSSRKITDVQPSYIPAVAQPPPPMWNSGIATRLTASPSSSQMSFAIGSRLKKLEFESITPFGRPVVPDEYSWKACRRTGLGPRVVGREPLDPFS